MGTTTIYLNVRRLVDKGFSADKNRIKVGNEYYYQVTESELKALRLKRLQCQKLESTVNSNNTILLYA